MVHISTGIEVLKNFKFEEDRGSTRLVKEPIGVCGLITPWNWPINQIACKVIPALAPWHRHGAEAVRKKQPFSAYIWCRDPWTRQACRPAASSTLDQRHRAWKWARRSPAQLRGSTYGLVHRFDPGRHVEVSPQRGRLRSKRVAWNWAARPNIILEDADMKTAVGGGVRSVMNNSGQSCNAPTRMLVPAGKMDEAIVIAKAAAESVTVGDPNGNATIGPVVNKTQWEKIQRLIQSGIAEGATLVTGGPDRPDGLDKGFYVKPTVFANVTNEMTIAKEEILGPVVSIMGYKSVDEAVKIGNDTEYGLAAYISGTDQKKIHEVAAQLAAPARSSINGGGGMDPTAPFGGYKMKRQPGAEIKGDYGFHEYRRDRRPCSAARRKWRRSKSQIPHSPRGTIASDARIADSWGGIGSCFDGDETDEVN